MEELSFEESLEKLEEIVNKLESGDIPLDEAIDEFNRLSNINESILRHLIIKLDK